MFCCVLITPFLCSRHCVLLCSDTDAACPPGVMYADVLEFRVVALRRGIPAREDLIRLVAYDHMGVHLPRSTFKIMENDEKADFQIRIEGGKGVVYTLLPLDEKRQYRIKVRARSYDNRRPNVQYQTSFIIFISVSLYPY